MLRVGSVPYLVARPLDLGLGSEPDIALELDVPARLVDGLRSGALDVALVSSIELYRQPGYAYIDGLAVAGEGAVSSVQVFLERPLAEVRSVALDPASRTAAALAQVVWPGPAERRPRFLEVESGRNPRFAGADAWLRIGDTALRETYEEPPLPAFNPSRAWRERTGLPFVFAAWIVRPDIEMSSYLGAFERARARGAAALEELATRAARQWNLSFEITWKYLAGECLYEPGTRQRAALMAFRDAAAALDLCRADLEPRAIERALDARACGARDVGRPDSISRSRARGSGS